MQQPTTTTKPAARGGRPLLIAGFPVRVGWSAVAVVAVIAWSLAGQILPLAFPGYAAGTYWAAGIFTGALFLGSVLTHELGHALLARRSGLVVEDITLWAFGGLARIRGDAPSPREELRIAAVGPLTSLAIGIGFLIAAVGAGVAGVYRTGRARASVVVDLLVAMRVARRACAEHEGGEEGEAHRFTSAARGRRKGRRGSLRRGSSR
jgi:Zn-dependent protease